VLCELLVLTEDEETLVSLVALESSCCVLLERLDLELLDRLDVELLVLAVMLLVLLLDEL
jgi:hypothetical protein